VKSIKSIICLSLVGSFPSQTERAVIQGTSSPFQPLVSPLWPLASFCLPLAQLFLVGLLVPRRPFPSFCATPVTYINLIMAASASQPALLGGQVNFATSIGVITFAVDSSGLGSAIGTYLVPSSGATDWLAGEHHLFGHCRVWQLVD
jgi:hypothetical protein